MTDFSMTRRRFGATLAGVAGLSLLPRLAFAQDAVATRTITTVLGTYDIPADPQRVLCIDSRLDLEPAVALGLNVVGHAYGEPMAWVPSNPDWVYVGEAPNLEQVLALGPDLIICTDVGDPDSEWWPINRLREIAPVLPPPYTQPWKAIVAQIGGWTGREGQADAVLAEYDALIADIKARHGDKIATRTVAAVQPADENMAYLQADSAFMQPQVLADLGAKTLQPIEGGAVSAENYATVFGELDGILLVNMAEGSTAPLDRSALWQRLPAVEAGAVLAPIGNTNYGGVYTAMHVARLFDELYGMMD